MGIRFYCPNGHKLNVKAFQAGQKGICPICGAKMPIPLTSTRPSSREQRRTAAVGSRASAQGGLPAGPAVARGAAAAGPSSGQHGEKAIGPIGGNGSTAGADAHRPLSRTLDASPSPAARSAVDPLIEEATWYVRPATGGQFGPANSEIMRIWLAEGRIAADTLVWRDGWRDWQEARSVFRQVPPSGAGYVANADHHVSIGAPETPGASAQPRHAEVQPKGRRLAVTVLVVGGLVFLALLVALLGALAASWGHR